MTLVCRLFVYIWFLGTLPHRALPRDSTGTLTSPIPPVSTLSANPSFVCFGVDSNLILSIPLVKFTVHMEQLLHINIMLVNEQSGLATDRHVMLTQPQRVLGFALAAIRGVFLER